MDWFLYDRDPRHEIVEVIRRYASGMHQFWLGWRFNLFSESQIFHIKQTENVLKTI